MLVFSEMRIILIKSLRKLFGSGRDNSSVPTPGVTAGRQKKKTKFMLTLLTAYPYGLIDRVGDEHMAEERK